MRISGVQWLVDLFVLVRASSLGQDAVIEIMIGLLGIMIAVLSLVVVLLSVALAALGVFGYKAIEERSVLAAEKKAADIAEAKTAEAIADYRSKEQAVALGASQPKAALKKRRTIDIQAAEGTSVKKTSDSALVSRGKNNGRK